MFLYILVRLREFIDKAKHEPLPQSHNVQHPSWHVPRPRFDPDQADLIESPSRTETDEVDVTTFATVICNGDEALPILRVRNGKESLWKWGSIVRVCEGGRERERESLFVRAPLCVLLHTHRIQWRGRRSLGKSRSSSSLNRDL